MAETISFWVRFFGGENGDPRPVTYPIPLEWWCTGTDDAGTCTICALVVTTDDVTARREVAKYWPEVRFDEVLDKGPGWRPPADRFPRKRKAKS